MSKGNKFGFEPLEDAPATARKSRKPGPMGAAVREAAESLSEATETKLEQRRQNAADAKAYRMAQQEGRVLVELDLASIHTDDLPRDRLDLTGVAASDEMEELKTSIRTRGQKEPIEVYEGADGRLQLKKGWRRFTALKQLHEESGDPDFSTIIARFADPVEGRMVRYVDMVEENVVREDLSFAEMAQVAITAAADPDLMETDPDAIVGRLYASLHKMKRSYVRSFVFLLRELGEVIRWPKEISRNLGVDVARALRNNPQEKKLLSAMLVAANTPEEQNNAFRDYLQSVQDRQYGPVATPPKQAKPREKFEIHVGKTKVTARKGECRIVSHVDFTAVPRDQLVRAIEAFEASLAEE